MDVLLNWLWQGGLVAVAAAVVLQVIPRWRTQLRYRFVWIACAGVLALPAVPYMLATASSAPVAHAAASRGPVLSIPTAWWTSKELAIGLWIIWAGIHAVRLATALAALRAARARCRACPPGLESRLHHWRSLRLTGRRTRMMLSTQVRSAAVLGGGSPVIAVAPALLQSLTDEDLDRVVVHEWAHVQRRDDVAQFVQRIVRMIAGWHPAVWWLERQLDLEREVACDEMTVAVTGSAKAYAACLTTLAALRPGPVRSLPALAAVSSSGLRRRIVRILAGHPVVCMGPGRAVAVGVGVVFSALTLVVGNVPVVRSVASSLGLPNAVRPAAPATAPYASRASDPIVPPSVSSVAPRRRARSVDESVRVANGDNQSPRAVASSTPPTVEPTISVETAAAPPEERPLDGLTARFVEGLASEAPALSLIDAHSVAIAADTQPAADARERAPWAAATDAGLTIGRGSRNAGAATARFFTRFSRTIAGSF